MFCLNLYINELKNVFYQSKSVPVNKDQFKYYSCKDLPICSGYINSPIHVLTKILIISTQIRKVICLKTKLNWLGELRYHENFVIFLRRAYTFVIDAKFAFL